MGHAGDRKRQEVRLPDKTLWLNQAEGTLAMEASKMLPPDPDKKEAVYMCVSSECVSSTNPSLAVLLLSSLQGLGWMLLGDVSMS